MTRFGQFENQAQAQHQDYSDELSLIEAAIAAGTISQDLLDELNVSATDLSALRDAVNVFETADVITAVYSRALEGDFEGASVTAAEFAASQYVERGVEDTIKALTDQRVLDAAGINSNALSSVSQIAADNALSALIDLADATFDGIQDVAANAIANEPAARVGYRAQQPLTQRVQEYRENSATNPAYDDLLADVNLFSRAYASVQVTAEIENTGLFSFIGRADRVTEDVQAGFDLNQNRLILELSVLEANGLVFDANITDYATAYATSQLDVNDEFIDVLTSQLPLVLPTITGLVVGEFSSGGRRVTTNDQASLFVLAPGDTGVGSAFGDVMIGGSELIGREGDDTLVAESRSSTGANITGGEGNDTILGTVSDDPNLSGGADNDLIMGFGGNDTILGGSGIDEIDGGSGNDNINGGAGDDTIFGGDGMDTINGGADMDTINGGQGMDTINGGGGMDTLDGGTENDTINGGGDMDEINGGDGDDILNGDGGRDTIFGGAGNDTINGGAGRDTIDAGDGEDTITLSEGRDIIQGGDGFDTILGGAFDGISVDFDGSGDSNPDSTSGNVQLIGFQRIVGTDGQDEVIGWAPSGPATDSDGNIVEGGYVFEGLGGSDTLSVGNGEFTFIGGAGDDTVTIDTGLTSGFATVNIEDASAADSAFIDQTNIARIITAGDADPFEAWVQFTNDQGENDWEFIFFDEVSQIDYRYVVSTGELTVRQGSDRFVVSDFSNGDLGVSLPDNPVGPGVGGASGAQPNNAPTNFDMPLNDMVLANEFVVPNMSDLSLELVVVENIEAVNIDDWITMA